MEVTKFWTKTKIIILLSIIVIIGIVVGIVLLVRARDKKEYIKLEKQINKNAFNFFLLENLTLDTNEYKKVNIEKIAKYNLIPKKVTKNCDGYVIAENNMSDDDENYPQKYDYSTYLKCKNIYTTVGYGEEVTSKKENKTKTQTEKDTIAPVITLYDSKTITISVGDKFEDPGAIAEDNIDGDITKKIKVTGKVDTSTAGTYKLKYTVSDKAGNKSSKTRKVIVKAEKVTNDDKKDKVAPVITFKNTTAYQKVCIGEKVDISQSGIYGYSAHDNKDGDITKKVSITGEKGTITKAGEYTLTYTVKDKAGNEARVSRKFSGVDCSSKDSGGSSTTPDPTPTPTPTPDPTPTPTPTPDPTPTPTPTPDPTPSGGGGVNVEATGVSCQDIMYLSVGETQNLYASVLPSNATNKSLSYVSSNSGVARVDGSGNVTGVQYGETRITISTSNGRTKSVVIVVE